MAEIQIYSHKELEFERPTIIEAFPSVGLVGSIAGAYLIDFLQLELIGSVISEDLHPMAVVHKSQPTHAIRIYGNKHLIIFISEITPPVKMVMPLADKIIQYAKEKNAKMIIAPEGFCTSEKCFPVEEPKVTAITTSNEIREQLKKENVSLLSEGIITGVSGILLAEGARLNFPVVCLIAEASNLVPDARSAASLIQVIDKLLPEVEIDITGLVAQADVIEKNLKTAIEKSKTGLTGHNIIPKDISMYE